MSGPVRTRIAPTPSGYLHAGNAFNFMIIEELVKRQSGTLLLRIDDLDGERMRPEYVDDIFESLEWLGINWQEGPRDAAEFHRAWSQHLRLPRYNELLAQLRTAGHLYACGCSRNDAGTCNCRDSTLPFDGPGTAWRLRLPERCTVELPLLTGGIQRVDLCAMMRDPVLRRKNGDPAYHIASLTDDVELRMSMIVRGEDLLASSACQLHIARALGLNAFQHARFLHHPLLTDGSGNKLSKSRDATSLREMRRTGTSPDHLRGQAKAFVASVADQGL